MPAFDTAVLELALAVDVEEADERTPPAVPVPEGAGCCVAAAVDDTEAVEPAAAVDEPLVDVLPAADDAEAVEVDEGASRAGAAVADAVCTPAAAPVAVGHSRGGAAALDEAVPLCA